MDYINRKVISTVLMLCTIVILSCGVVVYAASSSVNARWYTGNGGSCNGKTNGVFHSLSSGSAYLSGSFENSNEATKTYPVVATLYRDRTGPDAKYGTVEFTTSSYSKHKIGSDIPKSSKYYIIIGAGTHDRSHHFTGTLSN